MGWFLEAVIGAVAVILLAELALQQKGKLWTRFHRLTRVLRYAALFGIVVLVVFRITSLLNT